MAQEGTFPTQILVLRGIRGDHVEDQALGWQPWLFLDHCSKIWGRATPQLMFVAVSEARLDGL